MLSLPISPAPPPMPTMSRRVPLSNIQNHHGQPYSLSTATIPAKRPAKPTRDNLGPPPAKKAHIDTGYLGPDQKENRHTTPSKLVLIPRTPNRQDTTRRDVVPSRVSRSKPTANSRRQVEKIDSQKYRKPIQTQKISTRDKQLTAAIAENNEAIRQWQRHYLKVFPTLTFYLDETVSEDKMAMLRIQLRDLDSAVIDHFDEERVTHVITARGDIPPETSKEQDAARTGTINPKLLGKTDSRAPVAPRLSVYEEQEDILVLARLNQMKIWNTEKVERMIHTLNEKIDDDYIVPATAPLKTLPSKHSKVEVTRPKRASAVESTKKNEEALGRLLNQDKTRSSQPSSSKEMYVFKGPYVLVGDASGRYKHFIIREFRNALQPESGDWPQFRSNREGRCPFVLDPDTKRAYMREEAEREAEAKAKEKEAARLRARIVMEPPPRNQSLRAKTSLLREDPRAALTDRRPISSIENKVDRDMATAAAATAVRKTESRVDKLKDAHRSRQDNLVLTGYEPVASGLRPTGPTSAVVSQAISSNPVLVGPKAGTSRDVQRLNRRVFEKTTGGIRQTNTTTALQVVDEENNEAKAGKKTLKRTRSELVVKEASKKQPVAGYCENCRDKYDDFEKHILSKRHLRFASNDENFLELDALLATLERPRKKSISPTPFH
ncbi:hypothetical protein EYR41_000074 [Orbilia oligospora]|uniref:DBF4-type domain-containing protein n=1 Tax=Orbilia oligospora TaxID=2813651 RepID=A0A8H2E5R4_ORBOL|nr:hypothetical protein EYR41_000074 [Orbilia oligospora]